MATLTAMKLDKKKQISYRSTDQIVAKLDLAAAKLAARKLEFGGNKLRTGHLVNAIALWVGEMPDDELVRFARPLLSALEAYLGRDEDSESGARIGASDDGEGGGSGVFLGGSIRKVGSNPKRDHKPAKTK